MDSDLQSLMLKNGFWLSQPSASTDEDIEVVAICGLGCNTKRTGRFLIPKDATAEHPVVRRALKHVKWCRNAQHRKRLSETVPKRQQAAARRRREKDIIWRSASKVLRDYQDAPLKKQAAEFKKECDRHGVEGVTENTYKRIKYRIRAVPF